MIRTIQNKNAGRQARTSVDKDFSRRLGAALRILIDARQLSQTDVAKGAGISNRALTSYLAGSQSPGAAVLASLCRVLGADANDLLGIDGDYVPIKLYAAKASGGHGRIVESEDAVRELHFRRDWLAAKGHAKGNVGAVQVEGHSMAPEIRDGDVILFDRTDTRVQEGASYVVRVGESLNVKELRPMPDGDIPAWGKDDRGQDKLFFTIKPHELSAKKVEIVGRVFWRGGRA